MTVSSGFVDNYTSASRPAVQRRSVIYIRPGLRFHFDFSDSRTHKYILCVDKRNERNTKFDLYSLIVSYIGFRLGYSGRLFFK